MYFRKKLKSFPNANAELVFQYISLATGKVSVATLPNTKLWPGVAVSQYAKIIYVNKSGIMKFKNPNSVYLFYYFAHILNDEPAL